MVTMVKNWGGILMGWQLGFTLREPNTAEICCAWTVESVNFLKFWSGALCMIDRTILEVICFFSRHIELCHILSTNPPCVELGRGKASMRFWMLAADPRVSPQQSSGFRRRDRQRLWSVGVWWTHKKSRGSPLPDKGNTHNKDFQWTFLDRNTS